MVLSPTSSSHIAVMSVEEYWWNSMLAKIVHQTCMLMKIIFEKFTPKYSTNIHLNIRFMNIRWTMNGSIQTLFRGILKSLNILISTGPSDSSSKMSQKTENIRSRDCRNFRKFSIQSFETLTRFCGNTVCLIWNLTGPCERGRRDLYRLVLWRYTYMALIGVFIILLNRSNRRLSKIRNHTLSWKNFYIRSIFSSRFFWKIMSGIVLII